MKSESGFSFAIASQPFRICLNTIKICLKSAKGKFPTFIASCHSSQQTLLAMIILSLNEDCCLKRSLSSLLVLHCSDCYVICFMLRCDGDVKGIGENRKLLKEKNVGKILSFLNLTFGMSFYFLEGSLSFVKIQSKIKSKTCVSSIVPLSQSTRSSAVLLLSQSHTATYQYMISMYDYFQVK